MSKRDQQEPASQEDISPEELIGRESSLKFGKRVEGLRATRNWTRFDVHDKTLELVKQNPKKYTEISHQRLSRIELGTNKNISLDDAVTLAAVFQNNIGFLLHEADEHALVPDMSTMFFKILEDSQKNKGNVEIANMFNDFPDPVFESLRRLILDMHREFAPNKGRAEDDTE